MAKKSLLSTRIRIDGLDMKKFIKEQPKLVVSTMNSTGKNALSHGRKLVKALYTIKPSALTAATRLKRAFGQNFFSDIIGRAPNTPLKDMGVKPRVQGARKRRERLSVEVKRGERREIKDAFIVNKLGFHVFQRTTAKRLPIRKLYTISAAHMLWHFREQIAQFWQDKFASELRRRIDLSDNEKNITVKKGKDI